MKRRNFLASFFAAIAAMFMPWRKVKALPAPKTKEQIQQEVLQSYLNSPKGRVTLARYMTEPLRRRIDYAAVARKTFLVEQLPDGAIPIYDRNNEHMGR